MATPVFWRPAVGPPKQNMSLLSFGWNFFEWMAREVEGATGGANHGSGLHPFWSIPVAKSIQVDRRGFPFYPKRGKLPFPPTSLRILAHSPVRP